MGITTSTIKVILTENVLISKLVDRYTLSRIKKELHMRLYIL